VTLVLLVLAVQVAVATVATGMAMVSLAKTVQQILAVAVAVL
jgi:hypothetical protein